MRSIISTSVTYTPPATEGMKFRDNWSSIISPYRCAFLFVHQPAFDQNFAVFAKDPRGCQGQCFLRYVRVESIVKSRSAVSLEFGSMDHESDEG